jgi:putative hydrolase
MVAAVRNPHVTVLGHCTGRLIGPNRQGRGRGPSRSSTRRRSSRPAGGGRGRRDQLPAERPTRRPAAELAAEAGCLFAIDTDAHAPGQLDWLVNGTFRAERAGITADRVINTAARLR